MANVGIASTRVQFKYETYDYELDKNVTVNVSIGKIKRNADKDQIIALGEKISVACDYNGLLSTNFISTDVVKG